MAFLRETDYLNQIQREDLDIITDERPDILRQTELAAQSEIESYLRHRFDVAAIYIDVSQYQSTTTYNTGDLVSFPDYEDSLFSALDDGLVGITPTDDPSKWLLGDTRHQLILMHMVDVTLYHLHARVQPRNIPEYRIQRYDDCMRWFKMVNSGKITPALPTLPDDAGSNIRFGFHEKFNHF